MRGTQRFPDDGPAARRACITNSTPQDHRMNATPGPGKAQCSPQDAPARHTALPALTLGALGVVYGDIGTSPLYTLQAVFSPDTGLSVAPDHVIGAISTIFWALMLVVTLKYVILVLRADNRGEGGILALASLAAHGSDGTARPRRAALLLMGVAGATLFYGDSVITPAISVLGAVEGLQVVAPGVGEWVLPIAVCVLSALFAIQRWGTGTVGKAFGPVMLVWFAVLAVSGLVHVVREPAILAALNPLEAWQFLQARGWKLFALMGAIVLALTGAEALYADLGHFGRRPIQLAWTVLVLPSLALNYMGQGALLMGTPAAVDNPFFRMFPQSMALPMVVLATLAAVIASQAVISGAYSMTRQAIQLGFLPRLSVRFTSARDSGQIYMPAVNSLLLVAVILAVLSFRSSAALAGAYGIAVTLTMLLTTVLAWHAARVRWRERAGLLTLATLPFAAIDLLLVAGCSVKLLDGGWFPLGLGLLLFILIGDFLQTADIASIHRARRIALYLVNNPTMVPNALLHNMKHNQVLHEHNLIVHVRFHEEPWVCMDRRIESQSLGHDFWHVTVHYGFMNVPDVPKALALLDIPGVDTASLQASWFLSHPTLVAEKGHGLSYWRSHVFVGMSRLSGSAAHFFRLPDNAVIELGNRVQL
jgi:KUP system potassium uptake protein